MHLPAKPAFGRVASPDQRDAAYPLRSLLAPTPSRSSRFWPDTQWRGDQKNLPQCVGYAWAHYLHTGPVYPPGTRRPYVPPATIYAEAQKLDDLPGENYDGTTVRGAAKALKARGIISSYHWARNSGDIARWILDHGPVVVGTLWTEDMCEPDSRGFIHPTGENMGGHAWLLTGVSLAGDYFRALQSWGLDWGQQGRMKIRVQDLDYLLREDGEACIAVESYQSQRSTGSP